MKQKRMGHSSDKAIQKCCKVSFIFWLQRRPKTLLNERSSSNCHYYLRAGVNELEY